jgi:2-polyprenyl-3-methyl-5-hydroxy-6-metoxy-1,4-benzoquinol methylase
MKRRKTPAEWNALCGACRRLTNEELEILYWYQEVDSDRVVVPPNILRHSRENSDARYLAARRAMLDHGVPTGSRILDIGCGISAQADLFEGFAYFGADLNRARLARGRAVHPAARYAVQDIRNMGWKQGAFAVILCLEVIEHVPVDARAGLVRELLRALARGGLLVLTTPNGKLTPWKLLLGRRCERSHEAELAASEVADLLTEAGGRLLATGTVDNLILPAGKASAAVMHLVAGRPKWRRRLQRLAEGAGYQTVLYVAAASASGDARETGASV